jgi:pimeloyl-ACP methyl ester carboxylesterase
MAISSTGIILFVLRFVAIAAAIYLLIALVLVLSQSPSDSLSGDTLDFSALSGASKADPGQRPEPAPLETYQARDGTSLSVRRYRTSGADVPLLVFIHGSGWHGGAYDDLARRLSATGEVDVLLPDLRGHGPDTATRGDIAYIGQLEDDIADLIKIERQPGQKLVIGGHSSGGGLAVRYAGGAYGSTLDGAVLMAPYLRHDAPTTRAGSGGWAQPLTRRIIGLSMLNAVGITVLNGLTAIQFRFPPEVLDGPEGATATASYSFRLNTAYAPRRNYLADVANLPPFLLIAGTEDEAFVATAYQPLMDPVNSNGRYALIEGQSHLGVINSERAVSQILEFLGAELN